MGWIIGAAPDELPATPASSAAGVLSPVVAVAVAVATVDATLGSASVPELFAAAADDIPSCCALLPVALTVDGYS